MSKQILDLIKEERAYLHDIANKITIVQGMTGIAAKKLDKADFDTSEVQAKLDKALSAVNQIVSLVKDRRSKIVAIQEQYDD